MKQTAQFVKEIRDKTDETTEFRCRLSQVNLQNKSIKFWIFIYGINQSEPSVFTFVHIVCIEITDWSYFDWSAIHYSGFNISQKHTWTSVVVNLKCKIWSLFPFDSIVLQKVKKIVLNWFSCSEEKMSHLASFSHYIRNNHSSVNHFMFKSISAVV